MYIPVNTELPKLTWR